MRIRHCRGFSTRFTGAAVFIGLLLLAEAGRGETAWNGAGDWYADAGNWSQGVPGPGADAVIASGSVILTNETPLLGSLTMTNGLLTFSSLAAVLQATNVWINGGLVRHVTNMATAAVGGEWPVNGRVYFRCTNFVLLAPGKIDVTACGWRTSTATFSKGYGPGAGSSGGAGGYGGFGGNYLDGGGRPYGNAAKPDQPGSGAGAGSYAGVGGGGGLVWIEASGTGMVSGDIVANGTGAVRYGGSGGGIWISCGAFGSAGGGIQANGGAATATSGQQSSGGGGRIALDYTSIVYPISITNLQASRGLPAAYYGDIGTLYLPDTRLLGETLNTLEGQLVGPWSSWEPANLMISNRWIRFPVPNFTLAVSSNLTVMGSKALLEMGGSAILEGSYWLDWASQPVGVIQYSPASSTLTCGGDLALTNGGCLRIFSGPTNSYGGHGALVEAGGRVHLNTNSWIFPVSHPTNGGSALFRMPNLIIVSNAGIDATQVGFAGGSIARTDGFGPGGGGNRSGGGYGGMGCTGGAPVGVSGAIYGSSNAPVDPGSGGGREVNAATTSAYTGGSGGGLIRLEIANLLSLDGTLKADGRSPGASVRYIGGGSGGGIFVRCRTLKGTGALAANGGNGGTASGANRGGSGGGGRIAVMSGSHGHFTGRVSVEPGAAAVGNVGEPGTVAWVQGPVHGTVMLVR